MARFVYWPSKKQVSNHVLRLVARTAKKYNDQVAVAECGPDLDVVLVKHDGTAAAGTATLDQKHRRKDVCPVLISNANHGDRVRVLHKVTKAAWSTDLTILVEHPPAKGGSLDPKVTPDTIVPEE